MFYEPMTDFWDKSYYVDQLEKITKQPRRYWSNHSLSTLRKLFLERVRQLKKESSHGYSHAS